MLLSELLRDRELWQNNTVNRMKDALLYKPTKVSTMSSGDQLVVVYGPPQIGKTTLILNLLGIEKEYQEEVYEVLRAGVKKGNSSTSTAIIYQKSSSDLYGARYENTEEQSDDKVQFFTADAMIRFLKGVRENVERGSASKDILYIFLPSKFFSSGISMNENIDILDLPGDGSRNEKEADHVQGILRKYLAMASVSIIACKGNEIQSLEMLEIQDNLDWRLQPNKYIGVITNAYGQGSIKKYFSQTRSNRSCGFEAYVDEQYEASLRAILPAFCQVKFYPVDMGESLGELLDSLKVEDRITVEETLNNKFRCIRNEIISHQGNTLKSSIELLRRYSSEYVNDQIEELQSEIEDIKVEYTTMSQRKSEKTELLAKCDAMISALAEEYEIIIGMEKHLVNCSCQYHLQKIISFIENKFAKRISDPKHLILSRFQEIALLYLKSIDQQVEYEELRIGDSEKVYSNLAQEIPFEAEIESFLYPKGFVNKFYKADRDKCLEIIERNFTMIRESVSKKYIYRKQSVLKQYKTLKDTFEQYIQLKVECSRDIDSCKRKLDELNIELSTKSDKLIVLMRNREKDQQVLSEYLKVAKDEFQKQTCMCKNMLIGSTQKQKASIIVFMALLERDYNKLMRGDYGTASDNGN